MNTAGRMNTLLMELLIVIFFFMIGSCVLVQVFGRAHTYSEKSENLTHALAEAQSTADLLRAGGDAEAVLTEQGFSPCGTDAFTEDAFTLESGASYYALAKDGWSLVAGVLVPDEESLKEGGALQRMQVGIVMDDSVQAVLPCSRYVEGDA